MILQVALCTDGGSYVTASSVASELKQLYATLGIRAEVHVSLFSFMSDNIAQEEATLNAADIFWFAGVHRVPQRLREVLTRNDDEIGVNDLAAKVRSRVQYDHMPYVGVCGGASMASSPETCVYGCGLDLMQGQEIYYGQQAEVSSIGNRLAFTEKCAFAVLCKTSSIASVCFPCVKNGGQCWDFAADQSALYRSIVLELAKDWKKFRASGTNEVGYFNLRGYYCYSDSDELFVA